jgi:adenosylcobinamide-phosphate synthase
VLAGGVTVWFGISIRCLANEALAVASALEGSGVGAAGKRLARIVGRDTSSLGEHEICMAAIETVAENFVDGVLSPFFYAAVAGPAGCMAYKMINTLDSMIGYRNREYILFGRFAARMDDVANFIPARLSLLCVLPAVSLCCLAGGSRRPPLDLLRGVLRDMGKHSSPNSGLPESAFAWGLGVRIGGPVVYRGREVDYPYINEHGREPVARDIRRAVFLLYASSAIMCAIAGVMFLAVLCQ